MTITNSGVKSILILIGFFAGASIQPATAQTTDRAARAASYKQVTKSCAVETRRFCPALDPVAPQPRSAAICLKPYKSSLSQACRRAVRATSS